MAGAGLVGLRVGPGVRTHHLSHTESVLHRHQVNRDPSSKPGLASSVQHARSGEGFLGLWYPYISVFSHPNSGWSTFRKALGFSQNFLLAACLFSGVPWSRLCQTLQPRLLGLRTPVSCHTLAYVITSYSWKASPQVRFLGPKPGVGTIAGCTPTVLRVGFLGGDRPW